MLGTAAVTIWCDVLPEVRDEFEDWHSREHMPERIGIPGFLRGSRWVSEAGGSLFILYELDSPATLTGPDYLARLNDPTPWSRKMMPHHRNMVRSLCLVRDAYGTGQPRGVATVRFSPGKDLPRLPRRKGVTGASLLQAQPMQGAPTTEQKIRGGDATADWVLLIGGYDLTAVRDAAESLAPPGATLGLYRLSYSLGGS